MDVASGEEVQAAAFVEAARIAELEPGLAHRPVAGIPAPVGRDREIAPARAAGIGMLAPAWICLSATARFVRRIVPPAQARAISRRLAAISAAR